MRVSEAMSGDVKVVNPEETLQQAARLMAGLDTGFLPVGENDRLVGTLTDRDIAVRAVAEGKDPQTKVRDVMTGGEVQCCFEDEDVETATVRMSDAQVRRMPVLTRDKRLVGVLALGDLAAGRKTGAAAAALTGISQPSGA